MGWILLILAASPFIGQRSGQARGQETLWKPAPGPLATRWSKDVRPDNVLPDHPRPQLVRADWLNLNGLWEFDIAQPGDEPPFGRALTKKILVPFPVESSLSGVGQKAQEVWYRRTFRVDPWMESGKRILLHFGAVDWETRVWVNGREVAQHRGGYDAFSVDITDALIPAKEQELVLHVWDPSDQGFQPCGKQAVKPEGIWYTSTTGIWQTVWLEAVQPMHVAKLRLIPDIDAGKLNVEAILHGVTEPVHVALVARDPSAGGKVVGGARLSAAPGATKVVGSIPIADAKLWSPEEPFLYDLDIRLDAGGRVTDELTSYFAMRKIAVAKDAAGVNRIFLNNKETFLFGPLDQGFWPDGLYTAPTDEALRYDVEITKQLGFNMTRKHVKVEPDRWYYWTDKLGLLVLQDMPSGDERVAPGRGEMKRTAQSARQFETELASLVDGLVNHPSIVGWVVFNEGWGQYDTLRISEWTKQRDPSRLLIGVSGWNDMKSGDIHDIHHYPPPKSPKPEQDRAVINGEYGGLGLPVEGHTWQGKDNWGYAQFKTIDELDKQYERYVDAIRILRGTSGLSAAVYTQLTDVEIEVNGLLTYDRAMIKGDLYRYREINRRVHEAPPKMDVVVATSKDRPQPWKYVTEQPAEGWEGESFDESTWKYGDGGFGKGESPGARVGTAWDSADIWLRREIDLPESFKGELHWHVYHDDEIEVYLNGKLALKLDKWTTDYEYVPLSAEAKTLLRPGKNRLAVHCRQDKGGQYVDIGLVERVENGALLISPTHPPATEPKRR
jgi:hypothetical protein